MCYYIVFEFTFMTFGHKNTPEHFYHSTSLILHDLLDEGLIISLVDILIYSKTD